MFEKKTETDLEDDIKIDAEEGEYIRDTLIPFSMEYYLKLVQAVSYGGHGDCNSCEN